MKMVEVVGVTLDVAFGYDDDHGSLLRDMPLYGFGNTFLPQRCRNCGTLQPEGRRHGLGECVLTCCEVGRMTDQEICERFGITLPTVQFIMAEEVAKRRAHRSVSIFTEAPRPILGSIRG
jgi:hypothetical protein